MKTTGYRSFLESINSAEVLAQAFGEGRSRGRPRAGETQLTRWALAYSIRALDRYMRALVIHLVGPGAHAPDELERVLCQMSFVDDGGLEMVLGLLGCDAPLDEFAARLGRPDLAHDLNRYASQGDLVRSGTRISVTKAMARDCIDLVSKIARAIDDVVGDG